MVVEDDNGLRNLIIKSLVKEGYIVEGVSEGSQAVESIIKDPGQLLLTDHRLPDMTGRDIIEQIGAKGIDVNFIVMTGQGDEKLAVEMMKLGAADYLVKEIGFIRLLPGILKRVLHTIDTEKRLKAAEEALKQSEYRFRMLAELAPVGIMMSDENGNALYISKKFSEIFGYSISDVTTVEQWFQQAFPDNTLRETARKQWTENHEITPDKKNDTLPMEFPVRCRDGSVRYTEFRFASTNALSFIVLTDITQRKKAEEALVKNEEKYRLIFEKSPLAVFHFDPKGILTECNDHFLDIMGSTKEQLIGLDLSRLPDIRMSELIRQVCNGNPASFQGVYQSVTGEKTTPIKLFLTPVISNQKKVEGGIGIVEDISAQIEKEEYQKQALIANESVKFKQNFLANMSHEIRTPLTGILGMIDIMDQTPLSNEQHDYINILKSSGENLKEIINQVLDFSKIEAGKVALKPVIFEFNSLIDNAKKLFGSLCEKDVEFVIEKDKNIPAFIKADRNRITQVINNLISNAVKFTNCGKITLKASLETLMEEELFIKIEVEDTGKGISVEKQQKLFMPFAEIHQNDIRTHEGSGLGLSICKELALLMGGTIGVKSSEGTGSCFWFTFSGRVASKTQIPLPGVVKAHSIKTKNLHILVAEDKKINQKVITLILESMGHEVTMANNGKEGVEMYVPGKYDLILMDIQMPVMDGISATLKLKEQYKGLPPIVGLSANAFEGDREKYMARGLDDYLTKPVRREDFNNMMERVFGP